MEEDGSMKRLVPFAVGGAMCLLTACSVSNAPSGPGPAHGLFVDQVKKPDEKLNTGIIYWLELNRDGKKSHVSNKTEFQSGDKLRIHVKPNIACYSYVLMMQGSNGEHAVLFPSDELPDNKLSANDYITLPVAKGSDEAWLKFDEHPGTEVVRVIVSRSKIDPKDQLPSSVVIASGSDDKIPDDTVVSTVVAEGTANAPQSSRNLTVETTSAQPDAEGETTVVSKDSEKPLAVDIAMTHKSGT
jgi:hypothetical protein